MTTQLPSPPADMRAHLTRIAEGGPLAVNERLDDLDREWTAGRMSKAVLGVLILVGLPLAWFVSEWFAVLPAVGGLLLAQYAVARRSWVGAFFCKLGFRSGKAIDDERMALKALRGDFRHLPTVHEVIDRDAMSRLEGEGGMVYDDDDKVDAHVAADKVIEATKQ